MWATRKQPKTMQDLFALSKQEWLDGARWQARILLRDKPYITIEDILAVYPRPDYLHVNITGSVFKDKDFVADGWTRSKRKSSNGRQVMRWRLAE